MLQVNLFTANISSKTETIEGKLLPSLDNEKALFAELSLEEQKRADKLVIPYVRSSFIRAHYAARTILADFVNCKKTDLNFAKLPYGKPYLPDYPEIAFNYSHSKDFLLLAVNSLGVSLGVDIEYVDPKISADILAKRFFTLDENVQLEKLKDELSPDKYRVEFFRLWTAKEAYLKAKGVGLKNSLKSFVVDLSKLKDKDNPQRVNLKDSKHLSNYYLCELEAFSGYKAFLACKEPKWEIVQKFV